MRVVIDTSVMVSAYLGGALSWTISLRSCCTKPNLSLHWKPSSLSKPILPITNSSKQRSRDALGASSAGTSIC